MKKCAVRIALVCFVASLLLCSPNQVGAQITIRHTQVKAAGSLSAKIIDPNGNPIVGATVKEMDENWQDALRASKTDAAGKFTFATVKRRKIYHIRVSADNFKPSEYSIKVNRLHRRELVLTLEVGT